jgi:hypothetical protein
MAIWRQILTALWCAMLGGTALFLLRETLLPVLQNGASLTDLPGEMLVLFGCVAAVAVFSFAAFFWVPLLVGSVVSLVILVGFALFQMQDAFGLANLREVGAGWIALLGAMLIVPSLAFVIWDQGEQGREREARKAVQEHF